MSRNLRSVSLKVKPLDDRRDSLRILVPYTPTSEDMTRSQSIGASECPRRYCWWWHVLSFDWDISPSEGCTFLASPKPTGWRNASIPCSRAKPDSGADQYEPREPHLLDDGVDGDKWLLAKLRTAGGASDMSPNG